MTLLGLIQTVPDHAAKSDAQIAVILNTLSVTAKRDVTYDMIRNKAAQAGATTTLAAAEKTDDVVAGWKWIGPSGIPGEDWGALVDSSSLGDPAKSALKTLDDTNDDGTPYKISPAASEGFSPVGHRDVAEARS